MHQLIGSSLTRRINHHFAALLQGLVRPLEVEVLLLVAACAESLGKEDLGVVVAHQFVGLAVDSIPIGLLGSRYRRKVL